MPYPLTFRPNAIVDVRDSLGALQAGDLAAQIFKPLVGLTLNDFTRVPYGAQAMAARAVVRAVIATTLAIPLAPSQIAAAGGAWLVQTKKGAAVLGTFAIAGGLAWDDDHTWVILAQL